MKTVQIGKLNKPIARMGLGTWAIGGGSAWGGDKDKQESIATIQAAPKLGVNLIDTAPGYNFGTSERVLGEALKGMNRDEVAIITKFGVVWGGENDGRTLFNKVNGIQLYWDHRKESILKEVDASLERLGVDYIDVYMSHWQSVEGSKFYVPIAETMDVLNELKAQGKIKAIGAANVSPKQVEEYLKWGDLDIVQAKYSVLDRAVEDELLPICKEHGVVLQAYSPLEMGLLTGTFPRDYQPVGAQIPKKWFQPENLPKVFDYLDAIKPLCDKYNCTIADLNMAWILAQDPKVVLLSGATTADQISSNVRCTEIELEASDVAMMRDLSEAMDK